jgi:cell division protein FtsW
MTEMTTSTAEPRATAEPRVPTRRRDAASARSGRRTPWRLAGEWLDRPLASFHLLMAVFVLMLGFGLTMVLSSSAATAFRDNDSAFAVFTNQAVFAALGLVAFVVVLRMPIGLIRRISTTSLIVSLALLVAVLVPGIGSKWNGAQSWITITSSISFQPSEVAKLALLLWAAHVMASVRSPYRTLKSLLIPVGPVVAIMAMLVMLQPDLGTTVTLAIVFLAVLYFAGAQLWIFGGLAILGVAGVIGLALSAGYRVRRITAWLHPESADPESTYQSFQGLYAMGSGGVFGVGIGQSKMKWGRLPNADSDFIFAIIGEELGLIGTLTVVLLFALLAYVGLRIARRNVDPFVKIAAAGGTVWLVGQAAINIGYVVGLLPVTGIPLPMFSRGGTSLVVTMVVFALLANFARREPAAMAALSSATPRGLMAFLGLGHPKADRVLGAADGGRGVARRQTRRAAKRAEKVRQARAQQRQRWEQREMTGTARRGRGSRAGARPAAASYPASPTDARTRPGRASRPASAAANGSARVGSPRADARVGSARLGSSRAGRPRAGGTRSRRGSHPIRRALGFPVPGSLDADRRSARPGRTVRP